MKNKPIIALFEENERNIAELYALYAEMLPKNKSFWSRLSGEELSHANQINLSKGSDDVFEENNFSHGIINHVMSYVQEEIQKAKGGSMSHAEALRTALRVERSMLEQKCFDIFQTNDKTIQEIFLKMNKETEGHVEMLLDEMKKNKFPL